MRDQPAAIQFGEDAGEPDLGLQRFELVGDGLGRADQHIGPQRVFIGPGAQIVHPAHAPCRGLGIDQLCRPFEQIRLLVVEMHDAVPGLGAGAFLGRGDVGRGRDIDLPAARMASRFPGLVIEADLSGEISPRGVAHRGEDRQAAPADRGKGVGRAGGDADRRGRLLIGLWRHAHIVEAMIGALERKAGLGPGALDHLEDLAKPGLALGVGDAVGRVGLRHAAAPDAEDQPAVAQLVDRRRLLGQPQRMAQRQDLHGDADLDPFGARGDGAGNAERRRQQRAPRLEMQFGQPHHVEPEPLGGVDLVHRLVEGLALGPAGKRRKLVKHAEFHDRARLLAALIQAP